MFLYPENWIEARATLNKSPFFRELETQLLQNDINAETAEQAFLDYLEKLDEVSRLEICGIYTQHGADRHKRNIRRSSTCLAVLSRETPHVYYYRQQSKGIWTAWEKLPV